MGRLAGLDKPRLGGTVVGAKQDHRVGVAGRGAYDSKHIRGGNKVYDERGILEGVDANKVAFVVVEDNFDINEMSVAMLRSFGAN